MAICGTQYYEHIHFQKNEFKMSDIEEDIIINPSRVQFLAHALQSQEEFIKGYDETYQIVQKLSEIYNKQAEEMDVYKGKPKPTMFAYSLYYVYFEQYSYIRGIAVQNVLISLAVVFGAVTFMFNFAIGACVSGLIAGVLLTMLTLIWLNNMIIGGFPIRINAISVVNWTTAVGFAVEFCVHILLKYKRTGGKKKDRVIEALTETGSSVFVGIFCTKVMFI